MKQLMCALFWTSLTGATVAQHLRGVVSDERGEPLPFADVYVEGTTRGTTTNAEGWYELPLEAGKWQVVYAYLGYETQKREVQLPQGAVVRQDVSLRPHATALATVEVRAGENPAHPLIRRAMAHRTYWLRQIRAFSCDAYVKGVIRVLHLPDQILGMAVEPEDMGLDSTGQGYVYLSETVSRYHYQWPDRQREVIVSSKVSGDARGITFNSAADLDLNFYRPAISFGREIVSPIAPGAFAYYRYELAGAYLDEADRLIYRIRLSPKNPELPAFHGEIHLVEGLWNLKRVDVWVDAAALNSPGVDTLALRQSYLPVADTAWRVFSQHIVLKATMMGIAVEGNFLGIFRNYELEPDFPKGFFGKELMRMEADAPQRDSAYWHAIRPVPLAPAERRDYRVKDSLAALRRSRAWLDSVDRAANRFSLLHCYTGYTHRNSWKGRQWSVGSPLLNGGFDAVRGMHLALPLEGSWRMGAERRGRLRAGLQPEYAFAEKQFRAKAWARYRFERHTQLTVGLSGGRSLRQFNERDPIGWALNSAYSLYDKRHLVRVYDKRWLGLEGEVRPLPAWQISGSLEWMRASRLQVQSNHCFCRKKDQPFDPNEVRWAGQGTQAPPYTGEGLVGRVRLRWQPGLRYITYPDFRVTLPGKWPSFQIELVRAWPVGWGIPSTPLLDFARIELSVQRSALALGRWGEAAFLLRWGRFLRQAYVSLPHFFHFDGNEVWFMPAGSYLHRFFALPYYEWSTTGPWVALAWEHNFRGLVLDRLPLLRKLGLETILSWRYLRTRELPGYCEWGVGLGKLGIGLWRVGRLDLVWNRFPGRKPATHLRLGITVPLDEFSAGK